MLPVVTEPETLFAHNRGLAGSFEGQDVKAALEGGEAAHVQHFFLAAVESVEHQQCRPRRRFPACSIEDRRDCEAVGLDGDAFAGWVEPGDGAVELIGGRGPRPRDSRVVGVAVQEEVGGAVVGGGAKGAVAQGDGRAVQVVPAFGLDVLGKGEELGVPALEVARRDPVGYVQDLGDVRTVVRRGAQPAQ